MSERFQERFQIDMVRFTNSGTESLMYAIRCARAYTGRKAIVKIEGGYHGGYDGLQVSVKPDLAEIGPADAPIPQVPFDVEAGTVHVVAYNDLDMLRRVLGEHGSEIAALVIEPVVENLSIVVPDEGYLAGVREACDEHGVVLVFDEVKTGLTAGYAGAAQRLGVTPDLITLAKSIGGGLPLAAFGGKREIMEVVVDGRMAHFGTYNGNPLVMAAAKAVDELCTQEALDAAEAVNVRAMNAINDDHRQLRAARPHCRSGRQGLRHLVDRRRCATTATTRRPTSGSPSSRGCGVSTAASSLRPVSTSSGSYPSSTPTTRWPAWSTTSG